MLLVGHTAAVLQPSAWHRSASSASWSRSAPRAVIGDPFFVGHVQHARVTLHFHEVRLDAAGQPTEIWELALEEVPRPASHEVPPPPDRRVGGLPGRQRPGDESEGQPGGHTTTRRFDEWPW